MLHAVVAIRRAKVLHLLYGGVEYLRVWRSHLDHELGVPGHCVWCSAARNLAHVKRQALAVVRERLDVVD